MKCCTFFGHRDTPEGVKPLLRATLIRLIENENVRVFYVGNHGAFDRMVSSVLNDLKHDYPYIHYSTILAYLPGKKAPFEYDTNADTIYPEGLETAPRKYAILKRNRWMLDQADYVITYVTQPIGGVAQFKRLAEKQGKITVNLANQE